MSAFFLTDPDNQSDEDKSKYVKKPSGNKSIRYKEAVAVELTNFGVPKFTAELAVIDLRGTVIACMHKKHTPHEAAKILLTPIEKMYKTDGTWHYR